MDSGFEINSSDLVLKPPRTSSLSIIRLLIIIEIFIAFIGMYLFIIALSFRRETHHVLVH